MKDNAPAVSKAGTRKGITPIKEINLAILLQFINELDCNKSLVVIIISNLQMNN